MRTKTLLIAAAALVAGVISSEAQTVYSVNVVGYVNIPLNEGFNMISTPLSVDGTGTNNTVVGLFTNTLPVNSQVYVFSGGGYNVATYAANKAHTATNWTANLAIDPGLGYWVSIPAGAYGGGTSNFTSVGTVLQGNLNNPNITGPGYVMVSSQAPIAGAVQTSLNYIPTLNDQVYVYGGGGYTAYTYASNKAHTATNWTPSQPNINVGQGFFLISQAGVPWTNNFIVQ